MSRGGDRLAALAGPDAIHLFGLSAPPPALRVRIAVSAPERTRAIARRSVALRAVKVS